MDTVKQTKKAGSSFSTRDFLDSIWARVCLIKTSKQLGTGFLASFGGLTFILTCNHVVHSGEVKGATAIFDFSKKESETVTIPLTEVVCSSPEHELDYSVVRYDDSLVGDAISRRNAFILSECVDGALDSPVQILGHPEGLPQQMSLGVVRGIEGKLKYDASSLAGSSGSLVLDGNYKLVGMHTEGGALNVASAMSSIVRGLRNQLKTVVQPTVCNDFQAQVFRKDKCQNCFQLKSAHKSGGEHKQQAEPSGTSKALHALSSAITEVASPVQAAFKYTVDTATNILGPNYADMEERYCAMSQHEFSARIAELTGEARGDLLRHCRKTGLRYDSLQSPTRTYRTLLLLGFSGAGKSTLCNTFLRSAVCDVIDGIRGTSSVCTYETDAMIDEPLLPELCSFKLRVIDAPGFHDQGGSNQDAKFIRLIRDHIAGDKIDLVFCCIPITDCSRVTAPLKIVSYLHTFFCRTNMMSWANVVVIVTKTGSEPQNFLNAKASIMFAFSLLNIPFQPCKIVPAECGQAGIKPRRDKDGWEILPEGPVSDTYRWRVRHEWAVVRDSKIAASLGDPVGWIRNDAEIVPRSRVKGRWVELSDSTDGKRRYIDSDKGNVLAIPFRVVVPRAEIFADYHGIRRGATGSLPEGAVVWARRLCEADGFIWAEHSVNGVKSYTYVRDPKRRQVLVPLQYFPTEMLTQPINGRWCYYLSWLLVNGPAQICDLTTITAIAKFIAGTRKPNFQPKVREVRISSLPKEEVPGTMTELEMSIVETMAVMNSKCMVVEYTKRFSRSQENDEFCWGPQGRYHRIDLPLFHWPNYDATQPAIGVATRGEQKEDPPMAHEPASHAQASLDLTKTPVQVPTFVPNATSAEPPDATLAASGQVPSPGFQGAEPPLKDAEPPLKGAEPPLKGAEQPLKGAEQPLKGAEPPLKGAEQPLKGAEQPLKDAEPPLKDAEPPPIAAVEHKDAQPTLPTDATHTNSDVNLARSVGCGFHFINGNVAAPVFDPSDQVVVMTRGKMLATNMTYAVASSEEFMKNDRCSHAHLDVQTPAAFDVHAGLRFLAQSITRGRVIVHKTTIVTTHEFRLKEHHCRLSQGFLDDAGDLPQLWTAAGMAKLDAFIAKYGTHVIIAESFGGWYSQKAEASVSQVQSYLQEAAPPSASPQATSKTIVEVDEKVRMADKVVDANGGKAEELRSLSSLTDAKLLEWRDTIPLAPVALPNLYRLLPLPSLLKCMPETALCGAAVEDAIKRANGAPFTTQAVAAAPNPSPLSTPTKRPSVSSLVSVHTQKIADSVSPSSKSTKQANSPSTNSNKMPQPDQISADMTELATQAQAGFFRRWWTQLQSRIQRLFTRSKNQSQAEK